MPVYFGNSNTEPATIPLDTNKTIKELYWGNTRIYPSAPPTLNKVTDLTYISGNGTNPTYIWTPIAGAEYYRIYEYVMPDRIWISYIRIQGVSLDTNANSPYYGKVFMMGSENAAAIRVEAVAGVYQDANKQYQARVESGPSNIVITGVGTYP
jgi:hypothetical protein